MEERIDIKSILIRHKNNEIDVEQSFIEINDLIKDKGYFTGDDLSISFESGKNNKENEFLSKDKILDYFKDDVESFVSFITTNGFFTIDDINMFYKAGKKEPNSELTGNDVKEICIKAFNTYLKLKMD